MVTIEEISRFSAGNKAMVLIRTKGGVSVLDIAEYKRLLRMYERQNRK